MFIKRRDLELGECGRSLRSLASPVLRAFGAPSSDILLYPMLGIKSRGGKKESTEGLGFEPAIYDIVSGRAHHYTNGAGRKLAALLPF